MTAWERFVYALALAWWRAYWEMRTAARLAWKEPVTDADLARLARFRDAVGRMRADPGSPKPVDPAPTLPGVSDGDPGEPPQWEG